MSELKTVKIYWDDERAVSKLIKTDISKLDELSKEQLISMIVEFDRRLIQMWDKVSFERQHELVDYSKLRK